MKQYKKIIAAVAAAAILALPLSGCSFNDVMLYLYGGDSFTKEKGEDYQTYDGENGISVTYDANIWNEPSMSQEDTIGITTGNKLSYTAVLLQVSDVYTDFLEESAAELNEEAQTVRYDFDLTIPDAETESVRYDCGTYQMILAEALPAMTRSWRCCKTCTPPVTRRKRQNKKQQPFAGCCGWERLACKGEVCRVPG